MTTPSTLLPVDEPSGGTWVEDTYIIKLKSGHSKDDHLTWLRSNLDTHKSEITHDDWHSDAFHGYAAVVKPSLMNDLRGRSDIEYIEKVMESNDECDHDYTTQTDAPWGLSRLSCDTMSSKDDKKLDFSYTYHSSAGRNVNIYILDSAVKIDHDDFDQGRATRAPDIDKHAEDIDANDNGHATHCAGTAAGQRWGVAKQAKIISVKIAHNHIWDPRYIVAGVNYVINEAKNDKYARRIISYSAGRKKTKTIDEAFTNAVNQGIHCVVAAGNQFHSLDVKGNERSPASLDCVITVGNMTIRDSRNYDSNWGKCVDIWAPGHNIKSAWVGKKDASKFKSGTSMATPHVAGLLACMIAAECWHYQPAELKSTLQEYGRKGKLYDIGTSADIIAAQHND